MIKKLKTKIEKKAKSTSGESDTDFLKRIMSIKETAIKKDGENSGAYMKEMEEAKAQGAGISKVFAEREECEEIVEEFKKNPPLLTVRTIGGISVERFYDPKIQPKIDLLKKNGFSFLSTQKRTAIQPIVFEAFGSAYIKRGSKKVILPKSSMELPFIIRDGDIVGTEEKSFVLDLKDENQDEENNYWHVFLFPNSELKISIKETVSHPAPAFMVPEQVSDAVKKGSSSTVYEHKIEKIELLSGLFNIKVKKKGRDVNNIVKFTSGFSKIEFNQSGGLANEMVKTEIEKAVKSLGNKYLSVVAGTLNELKSFENKKGSDEINAIIELNKDGSVVIFNTSNRISLSGSNKLTKKISADINNPVKITATNGVLYETDGSKSSDPRVTAIMKMWMNVSQYIYSINIKNEIGMKSSGKSLSVEDAEKMAEYAKTLGDKDMESAAKVILQNKKKQVEMEKGMATRSADKEGQRKDAMEMLKFTEESGEKELIEVAKAQLKAVDAPEVGMSREQYEGKALQIAEETLSRVGSFIETNLPPYNHPSSSDVV
ncbi:MAG: hypothetical protein WC827_00180 [Candidatus Paceibacterota bacterium]|jgi:hypothetical protein